MAETPLTASTKQYMQDASLVGAATAFPAANANANSPTVDLGAGPRRQGDYIGLFKYDALPNLVDGKYITIKLQECATATGSYTDVGVQGTLLGGTGNGHAAGQIALPIPPTALRYLQVNVAVPSDAGTNTATNYTFGLGFWR